MLRDSIRYRRHRLVGLFLLLVAAPAGLAGQGWVPAECDPLPTEQWAQFEAQVRAAPPSSQLYVPKPFPADDSEVIADFEQQYLRTWTDTPDLDLPEQEAPLVLGLRRSSLKYRVAKVYNWTPLRCLPERPKQFFHVLRVYDAEGEIGRYALNQSGILAGGVDAPRDAESRQGWEHAWRSIEEVLRLAESDYGVRGVEAQYVTTVAGPLRCSYVAPCTAFRFGEMVYFFHPATWGGLFEIAPASPRISFSEMRQYRRAPSNGPLGRVKPEAEGLVSVGNEWVLVRRVPMLQDR